MLRGAIKLQVDRERMFLAFMQQLDRVLATWPKNENYERTLAHDMRRNGIERDAAVAAAAERHRASLPVFAFRALRFLLTNGDVLEELFTIAFNASMARARAEVRDRAIITGSYTAVYNDFSDAQMRKKFLDSASKRQQTATNATGVIFRAVRYESQLRKSAFGRGSSVSLQGLKRWRTYGVFRGVQRLRPPRRRP